MSRHNRQLNRRHRLAIKVPSTCLDSIAIRHGSNTFKATPVQGTGHSVLKLVDAGDFAVKGDVETTFPAEPNQYADISRAVVSDVREDNTPIENVQGPDVVLGFTVQKKRGDDWVSVSPSAKRARDHELLAKAMARTGEPIRIARPGAKRAVIAFNCD